MLFYQRCIQCFCRLLCGGDTSRVEFQNSMCCGMYVCTARPTVGLFAELATVVLWVATPIGGVNSVADKSVKGEVRPILHLLHQTMFDRVVVDVIDMVGKVAFITDLVLPKPALPNRGFASLGFAGVDPCCATPGRVG